MATSYTYIYSVLIDRGVMVPAKCFSSDTTTGSLDDTRVVKNYVSLGCFTTYDSSSANDPCNKLYNDTKTSCKTECINFGGNTYVKYDSLIIIMETYEDGNLSSRVVSSRYIKSL